MKPTTDLEARIMNRLQTMKRGQTIEELQAYLEQTAKQDPRCTHASSKGAIRHHVQGRRLDSGPRMTPRILRGF
jgi:hypothetical protein